LKEKGQTMMYKTLHIKHSNQYQSLTLVQKFLNKPIKNEDEKHIYIYDIKTLAVSHFLTKTLQVATVI
jgi:hypothetical protein